MTKTIIVTIAAATSSMLCNDDRCHQKKDDRSYYCKKDGALHDIGFLFLAKSRSESKIERAIQKPER
jgi:hypothetical protein